MIWFKKASIIEKKKTKNMENLRHELPKEWRVTLQRMAGKFIKEMTLLGDKEWTIW